MKTITYTTGLNILQMLVPTLRHINQNYIVPMVKLYEHYKMSGELQKQQWIKEKLLIVSKGSAEEDKIHDLLN